MMAGQMTHDDERVDLVRQLPLDPSSVGNGHDADADQLDAEALGDANGLDLDRDARRTPGCAGS